MAEAQMAPDEYALRDDEMTKEQFAEKAGVTLRAVEGWKADGKIAAEKVRRRGADGKVRKQLIFKTDDVDAYLNEADEPVKIPTRDKGNGRADDTRQGDMLGLMSHLFEQLGNQPRMSKLEQLSGKLFLDAEDAAKVSGIAKSRIVEAIHLAESLPEDGGRLQRFTGDHGRAVWRTTDLEKVIETIPPVPIARRLPPKRKE
jgi:hypothetical protein